MIKPEHQIIGHVSTETAYYSDKYFLNKAKATVRYWVETRMPYGQRVMRQFFNPKKNDWFNAKPITKYFDIVVMGEYLGEEIPQENGTSLEEGIEWSCFTLGVDVLKKDALGFRAYYKFDETQLAIIDQWIGPNNAAPDATPTITPEQLRAQNNQRPTRSGNPELEALKIREAELRIEKQELENEAKRLALEEQRLRIQAAERKLNEPKPVKPPKPLTPFEQQQVLWQKYEDLKKEEEQQGIMTPRHEVIRPPRGGTPTYDAIGNERHRDHVLDIIRYLEQHPDYRPSQENWSRLKTQCQYLEIDISELVVKPVPAQATPTAPPSAETIAAFERELMKR